MKKPLNAAGTLFSFDAATILDHELALSFEGLLNDELRVYYIGDDAKFDLKLSTPDWFVLGFNWSWSGTGMTF